MLLPKDYVRLSLTGEHALDKADGAGTLLFDLAARDWSPEVLDALRIPREWLPPTHEGPAVTGAVTAAAAAATGLRAGTPVVAGGGDQSANAVGRRRGRRRARSRCRWARPASSSRRRPRRSSTRRAASTRSATRCPDRWHLMSVMLSAAGSLRWLRDTLAPGVPYAELVEPAAAVPAGSDGLLFLPYLSGERSPHPDPLARGAFVGLTLAHDRRHLVRAVLEGVAFGLRDGLDLMVAAGMPAPAQVRASGGGLASPLWRQILADVLEAEIATVNTTEGAAFGAALLADAGGRLVRDGRRPRRAARSSARRRSRARARTPPALPRAAHARLPRAYPGARAVLPPRLTGARSPRPRPPACRCPASRRPQPCASCAAPTAFSR